MYDITISPAQLEDLPELARIYLHAFRPSPVMSKVLRPAALHRDDLTDQDRIRLTAQSLRRDYIDGKGAEQHVFLKAVRDGKVVGYAIWGKPELAKLDRPERDAGEEPSELNPEEDAQAIARLIVEIEQKRAVLMGDRPHWNLRFLVVDPEHQGQGVGGRLLRYGTDDHRYPVYLEASNAGVPLYKSKGFKEIGSFTVGDGLWAAGQQGGFSITQPIMLREPDVDA